MDRPTHLNTLTVSQLEAQRYFHIACECCKGTVWVPFRMIREREPLLSGLTLNEVGGKMRCDKCGGRPKRFYPARQEDEFGFSKDR